MRNYLHILRFVLINLVALSAGGAAMMHGWFAPAFVGPNLWLCGTITALFLYGLVHCFFRMWRTERDIARIRAGRIAQVAAAKAFSADGREGALSIQANLLRLRMLGGISVVRNTANTLVFLGLVGTVIGFIIALAGVDPEIAGDADRVAAMVARLVQGMSVAMYTTLTGALLYLWLIVGYRLLARATHQLFDLIVGRAFHVGD